MRKRTKPLVERRPVMGDFVVVPDGRIGMIDICGRVMLTVKFGAAGPFGDFHWADLRYATKDELVESDLYGTGGNIVGATPFI